MTQHYEEKNRPGAAHKFFSVIGVLLCVIFGFLLTCNLVIIIKSTINPEKPAAVFGMTPLAVLSGSMSGDAEDHIEPGDLIFVDKIDAERLQEGDVIAFMMGETVVTHRIVDIHEEEGEMLFTTQGDANNVADQSLVHEDDLVGIVVRRFAKVGNFILFTQTPLGMALFIGVPLFAFIIVDIIRRRRQSAEDYKKQAELMAELEYLRAQQAQQPAQPDVVEVEAEVVQG